ncbi:hypothetical protein [Hymenobacter tenuis]
MAATRDTRISRGYSFTFDEEGDKEKYHQHAKRRGLNLAALIKHLLAEDMAKLPAPPIPPKQ